MTKEELRQRICVTRTWTSRRAKRSGRPELYMLHFEKKMEAVLRGVNLADVPMDTRDPVLLAAEIEALCAMRTVRWWDTLEGLYIPGTNRNRHGRPLSAA